MLQKKQKDGEYDNLKLDYSILISPYPLRLEKIGQIKSLTLGEIFSPSVTYSVYSSYLSFLFLTPDTYYEEIAKSKLNWYRSLSPDKKNEITTFDLICNDVSLQNTYAKMFNLFFVEDVFWDNINQVFMVTQNKEGKNITVGVIHKNIFNELCDIILQRCAISRDSNYDNATIKSKKVRSILDKFKKGRRGRKPSKRNKSIEIPNLISSIAAKSKSINYTNIWQLTVYQLYDQFKREQEDVFLDVLKTSVAAYGNKDKRFKGNEWYTYPEDVD